MTASAEVNAVDTVRAAGAPALVPATRGLRAVPDECAQAEVQPRSDLVALLQGLSEGIIVIDSSGRVPLINDAARAILGLKGELRGADVLLALDLRDVHGGQLADGERPLERALRGEDFAELEVCYLASDGRRRRLVATSTSIKHASGAVAQAIVVLRDVTNLRRLEQEREEYMALISHDLWNPLDVVLMTTALLKSSMADKQLTADARHVLRIERNAARMATMLEELSEACSLESKASTLQRISCDLGKLVDDVVAQQGEPHTRRISIEASGAAPYLLLGDPAQLARCITNLLTNALKYSSPGEPVRLRLSRSESHVTLEVSDRGIGIAPAEIGKIFDRYHRTAAGRRQAEGLGLGLYITRLIIEAHGGRIAVRSQVGRGTTFSVTLPLHTDA